MATAKSLTKIKNKLNAVVIAVFTTILFMFSGLKFNIIYKKH